MGSSADDRALTLQPIGRFREAPPVAPKAEQAETYRRLACVVCELERYYLVHRAYPDQLSDLKEMPPHLNQEVLSMVPFHYQNMGQTYRLYSVG